MLKIASLVEDIGFLTPETLITDRGVPFRAATKNFLYISDKKIIKAENDLKSTL